VKSCARHAWTWCLLVALTLSGWARADIGVVPTTARGLDADAVRAVSAVDDVTRALVKERVVSLAASALPAPLEPCLADDGCRAELLSRLEIDELVAVELDGGAPPVGAFALARVVIWARSGRAFDARAPLANERDLRGLLTRALAPTRAMGRLDIEGLQRTDVVLIDGLRSEPMVRIAPGHHVVVVLHEDGGRTTLSTTVGFEAHERLLVPPRGQPPTSEDAWTRRWPVVIGGGVAGLGGAGTIAALVVAADQQDLRARDVALAAAATSGVAGITGLAFALAALTLSHSLEVKP
jgi:hypothetical protein